MQTVNVQDSSRKSCSGSAIVMVLIVVVIIAVLYFLGLPAKFNSIPESVNPTSSHEVLPWEEKHRLLKKGEKPDFTLSDEQPSIENGIMVEADVDQSNNLGGFIVMIDPDGTLTGSWGADYNKGENPRMNYVMNAEFESNIDPGNIFFDENGEDTTKLFFIASGILNILASNFETGGMQTSTQDIWVTG